MGTKPTLRESLNFMEATRGIFFLLNFLQKFVGKKNMLLKSILKILITNKTRIFAKLIRRLLCCD